MKKIFTIAFIFFILSARILHAQTPSVLINEVAWMGSLPGIAQTAQQTANDEWIELLNASGTAVSLEGWKLTAADGAPNILLHGILEQNQYILLARANSAIAGVNADIVYNYKNNALANGGENLRLINANGEIIDEINALSGWPAGDNTTKATMARTSTLAWVDGPAGGTPKAVNGTVQLQKPNTVNEQHDQNEAIPENAKKILPEEKTITEIQLPFVHTQNVAINELMPNPAGDDAQGEWIELYNRAAQSYDISGWFLNDYKIPLGTVIAPQNYIIFERPTTKIILANEAGDVRLLYPDGTVAYIVQYKDNAPEGSSYALVNDNWQWTETATPKAANKQTQYDTPLKNYGSKIPLQQQKQNNAANAEQSQPTITAQKFSAQIAQNNTSFAPGVIGIFIGAGVVAFALGASAIFISKYLQNKKRE